ncbi:MAG: acyl-CoA thioesterase [Myxococcales bacterium]|nr:acyl-CoA thioesterase [Myxococcales bacterium]USN51217.1 MAG: acyl-CoA thioesterase [Myxococcales bacterium]
MLKEFSVVIEDNLRWGDMDAFQHVNNTLYFRYFEEARIAYFHKIKIIEEMKHSGIGPILKSTLCTFRIPLTFPDTISIGTKVSLIESDRFLMNYAVFSHHHQKIAAEGEGIIVSFDYPNAKKVPLPVKVVDAIRTLERF